MLEVLCPPGPVVVPLPATRRSARRRPRRPRPGPRGARPGRPRRGPRPGRRRGRVPRRRPDAAALQPAQPARPGAAPRRARGPGRPGAGVRRPRDHRRDPRAAGAARRQDGRPAFTPYLSVDERGILVTSPSKTFNTAGLHSAQVSPSTRPTQARLRGRPDPAEPRLLTARHDRRGGRRGRDGDDWNAALVERLDAQRDAARRPARHAPARRPDAGRSRRPTSPWLDLRAYGHDDPAAAGAPRQGVRVAPGEDYQPGPARARPGQHRDRRPERLEQIVERLANGAVE